MDLSGLTQYLTWEISLPLWMALICGVAILLFCSSSLAIKQPPVTLRRLNKVETVKLSLRPNGIETFTPICLPKGRRCIVNVRGTYGYKKWFSWTEADVLYDAPNGNFTRGYSGLFFDGRPAPAPSYSDRHLHIYEFSYIGTGKKLCLRLDPAGKGCPSTEGVLKVVITPLSHQAQAALEQVQEQADQKLEVDAGALIAVVDQQDHNQQRRQERETRREQAAAEKEAKTAEEQQRQRQLATQRATRRQEKAEKLKVQQEDHKREQARQAKKEAEARAKLKELNLRAQRESHFLDAEYRENLAKNRTVEVLETKGDVDQEYDSVMGDEELLSLLRSDAPDVLEWLESRVEVIRLAERAAVAPAPPPPPPPKRRKPTEDDIRARKRYFIERAARDKIAEKEALLSSIREFGEALEQYEMDDDRDRLLHEFVEELVVEDPDQTKQIQ